MLFFLHACISLSKCFVTKELTQRSCKLVADSELFCSYDKNVDRFVGSSDLNVMRLVFERFFAPAKLDTSLMRSLQTIRLENSDVSCEDVTKNVYTALFINGVPCEVRILFKT